MHNRIKDVRSGSDDNDIGNDDNTVEGRPADKAFFSGIDTRKYANFLTLFNNLKRRNVSSMDIDHTRHLTSNQKERSEYRNVSVVEDCMPSTSFQHLNATSQNSNDGHVLESCQISRKLQPVTFSDMDLTMIPRDFLQKKLELHVDKQTCSSKVTTSYTAPSTNKMPPRTFDLLLNCSKREMQIDKDKGKKVVNDIAPFVQPYRLDNNTTQSVKTIVFV
ncbi:hypothetical protein LOAG_11086 [Loa loa]|uniref:Protein spaetzle n=1 Tax=Loa loa TaxID=7209 RepID=A0A1I7VXK3_LOALO|nr:hypothetical protein LOAG_11086 [Loa loa]EFO17414.2 hypothetical protein LOAG_11086 [Loa loa]